MKRLSIDQSTKCSGWAIFNNDELIKFDKIKIKDNYEYIYNLQIMLKSIEEIIVNEKPQKIIFENIQNQASKNVDTFKKLSGLYYGVMLLCEKYNIDYETYYSSEWRKNVGFKGKMKRTELKQKSKALIKEKYGVDVIDDISDAILIGLSDIKANKSAF